ncbi:MAG TPA: lmo0937 family membrane protein [Candidatus Angelobacter sp.]
MLWTLFVLLLLVWFLAVVGSYTMGGFVHVLLGLAVLTLVVQLARGRRSAT